MPRAVGADGDDVLELLQTVSEVGAPVLLQLVVCRSEMEDAVILPI